MYPFLHKINISATVQPFVVTVSTIAVLLAAGGDMGSVVVHTVACILHHPVVSQIVS
jgi:hypothetical protein